MSEDLSKIVKVLRNIGRAVEISNAVAPEMLTEIRGKSEINRKRPEFWRSAVQDLTDDDVASVARGLTYVELHLSWAGGSVSGVIWLFKELVKRVASRDLLDELSFWILLNTKNPYNPFGTQISLGAKNYSEYLELSALRSIQIARCIERDKQLEAEAAEARATRSAMAAAGNRARRSTEHTALLDALNSLPTDEKLKRIASHPNYPPQFFPTCIADAADQRVIDALPVDVRIELGRRLKGKRRGPWGNFKKRLVKSIGHVGNKKGWGV